MDENKGNSKCFNLEGILIPCQWNSDNHVISIVLSSPGETDYYIDPSNPPGKELSNYLSQKVRLKGTMKSFHSDKKVLTVSEYEIMDW